MIRIGAGCWQYPAIRSCQCLATTVPRIGGVGQKVFEPAFLLMGYGQRPVHPLQLSHDREVWVREPRESDLLWPDLSDNPILLAGLER